MNNPTVDRFGALASGLCALHCAITALLPSILATLGLSALLGHHAEWGFTLVAASLAFLALVLSWRRYQSLGAVVLLGTGIFGLFLARFLEEAEVHGLGTGLSIFAGVLLISGHVLNLRLRRRNSFVS